MSTTRWKSRRHAHWVDLGQFSAAAAIVGDVPTSYAYLSTFSQDDARQPGVGGQRFGERGALS